MRNMSKNIFKALSLITFISGFSYASDMSHYVDEINSVYQKIGLQGFGKGAYVQVGSNGKIDLKGDYKTYKDFEEAFYIAESIAGVSNVNPAFNVINANIVERPLEECTAYSMKNEPYRCPNLISAGRASYYNTKKLAILVAVGKFKVLNQELQRNVNLSPGPENDANLVAGVLRKAGFKIEKLYDQEATRQNVISAIRNAVERLPNNSILVLYLSTHGSPQTPIGETGAILYDSFIGNSNKCNYDTSSQVSNAMSRDIVVANAVNSAQGMCKVIRHSLVLSRDVLPLIAEANKNITLIVIEDICYSGASFKGYIPDAKIDDVYAPTKIVADNLVGLDPYPMMLITSASGEQTAEQAKINTQNGELCKDSSKKRNCVTHGIFTYYYFTGLPRNDYYLYRTYQQTFPIIEKIGQELKTAGSKKGVSEISGDNKQTPLFISNKNLGDFKF